MTTLDRLLLLARMEAACRQTRSHLGLIERQIARRAESLTITDRAKVRCHGRGRSTWNRLDERLYHDHVDRLSFERRVELDGLARKLVRQERAIADLKEAICHDTGSLPLARSASSPTSIAGSGAAA